MLVDDVRPKTLDGFWGSPQSVKIATNWFDSWEQGRPISKCLLLVGRPGLGKTTLAHILGRERGYEIYEVNASDERNMDDLKTLIEVSKMETLFENTKRLIILDEADHITAKGTLAQLSKKSMDPIILCVNDVSRLDYGFRRTCTATVFRVPTVRERRKYVTYLANKSKINIKEEMVKVISDTYTSYRSLAIAVDMSRHLWFGADDLVPIPPDLTIEEEVREVLKGERKSLNKQPKDYELWIFDNSDWPLTMSRVDLMMGRNYRRRYVEHALTSVRSGISVSYPRTISFLARRKRTKSKAKSNKRTPKTKVRKKQSKTTKNEPAAPPVQALDQWF